MTHVVLVRLTCHFNITPAPYEKAHASKQYASGPLVQQRTRQVGTDGV